MRDENDWTDEEDLEDDYEEDYDSPEEEETYD